MNPTKAAAIAVVAIAVALGGWLALPMIQSSDAAVDELSGTHVERARRLLHEYDPGLAYGALLRDQLGAEVDFDEAADSLAEKGADTYQEMHEQLWAAYEPKDLPERLSDAPPRPARANYGNVARQIRDGVRAIPDLANRNTALLDEALREVNEALATQSGDASGRESIGANQLKGVILYQKGLADQVAAELKRSEAERYRNALTNLAQTASQLSSNRDVVTESGIDTEVQKVEATIAEAQTRLAEERKEFETLEQQTSDLEARYASARDQADAAYLEFESLQKRGLDFSNSEGAEAFAEQMEKTNDEYTAAVRSSHMIEHGGYPNAKIDYTGDYVHGRYVENGSAGNLTIKKGLKHYRAERDLAKAAVTATEAEIAGLNADLQALEEKRESYAQQQADARQQIDAIRPEAEDLYGELNRVQSEAFAIEETAIDDLDQAARQFEQSARAAEQWTRKGQEATSDLPPEARQLSAGQSQSDDRWISGYTLAQAADARLAEGWIYHSRYRAAKRDATVLTSVKANILLAEADPTADQEQASKARASGIEEVKEAMQILERAHGQVNRHWTIAAQAAGTTYLLALFGETDYTADAIEGYRNALKGRENEPFASAIAKRLEELETR